PQFAAACRRPPRPRCRRRAGVGAPAGLTALPVEVTTVSDDEAVLFDGPDWTRIQGLDPGTSYTVMDETFRTLPRPPGERLATIATVNDVHFGETECGLLDGLDVGPVLRAEPGEQPYADLMNAAAIAEITATGADAVVAK